MKPWEDPRHISYWIFHAVYRKLFSHLERHRINGQPADLRGIWGINGQFNDVFMDG
jgi:hypothetical protein